MTPRHFIAAILLTSFALLSFIALSTFQAYPFSMDEYNYLYQAKIFASGHISIKAHPGAKYLREAYMILHEGTLFSKYPPGFPALLTFGVWLNIPALVNPVLSTITLFVCYRLVFVLTGLLPAILVSLLIATNSYFLGYGASYFAQSPTLLFNAFTFCAFFKFRQTRSIHWALLSGSAAGYCVLVRPLDGLIIAIVISGAFAATRDSRKHWRAFLAFLGPLALGMTLLCCYNLYRAGNFSPGPHNVWTSEFKLIDSHASGPWQNIKFIARDFFERLLDATWPLLSKEFLPHVGWTLPGLALLGLISLRRKEAALPICMAGAHIVLCCLLYNFHETTMRGWPQYGARYWYPTLVSVALLAGFGLSHLMQMIPPRFLSLIIIAISGLQLPTLAADLRTYSKRFEVILSAQKDVEQYCPTQSVVLLTPNAHWKPPEFVQWFDLKRNPFLNGPRLYVSSMSEATGALSDYPQYRMCQYFFPPRV